MATIINDPNKLDELKKINKTIIHDNQLDTFDNQLLALASGKLDNNYPMIIDSESNVLSYVDGVTSDSVLVMNISTAAKIQSKHPESYLFLSRLHSLLENSIFAMDSLTEDTSKVILLDEMLDNNPLIAICRYDKKHSASNPQIYVNEITSVYDKDNFISLIQRTWDNNKIFSKNKKIEEYLIKSTWLQLPTDLMFALSNSYDSESFNKSQVEYDLEVKRIDNMIIDNIRDNHGKCNGYVSSNIISSNDLINRVVNIRRMDVPAEFVDSILSNVYLDIDQSEYVWENNPIFDSDLSASLKAVEDGVINGVYDFTNWEAKLRDNTNIAYNLFKDNYSDILDELESDGVIANTDYNNNILNKLGISNDILDRFIVDSKLLQIAATKPDSNKDIFNDYCKSRTQYLPVSEDVIGNQYPTIMKCTINDIPNCSVIYVPNKVDCLCYIDSNKQLHVDDNTVPDFLAVRMNFDVIDQNYLSALNEYWDGLRLDEVMEVYQNREYVNEHVVNTKEGKEV